MSVRRIVPDIRSRHLEASREFYVDVLGDAVHSRAVSRGLNLVYPLTTEPWGVRRFFVTDPNGIVINVLSHLDGAPSH